MITGRKWKVKIAIENAESALRMIEITGTVANGKAGQGLHPQRWWSKESTLNRTKMVSGEIHHLEEARRFATAVGQRKQGAWTKWKSAKDRAVIWSDLKHMNEKIKFLHKSSLRLLTNTSQPSYLGG